MSECLSLEAIAQPGRWTAAERAHVAKCPRCAARARQCAEFVEGRTNVPPADVADAQSRLGAFLDERLGLDVAGSGATAARARSSSSWWRRLAAWFAAPSGRMALGFAALAIVAGGVWMMRAPQRSPAVVRGEATPALVVTARADARAANVALGWNEVAGADAYTVELLSADLTRIASFGPLARPAFTLAHGAVTALPAGTSVYCRVVARRAGVIVAESELVSLPLP